MKKIKIKKNKSVNRSKTTVEKTVLLLIFSFRPKKYAWTKSPKRNGKRLFAA